jgi:hypothetical protein
MDIDQIIIVIEKLTDLVIKFGTLIAAVIAVVLGIYNRLRIRDLHTMVNSRLSQLVQSTGDAEHAKGFTAGEKAQRDRNGDKGDKV